MLEISTLSAKIIAKKTDFLVSLQQTKAAGFRMIVHIAATEVLAVEMAQELLQIAQFSNVHFLKEDNKQKLLGTELDALVINAYQDLNPNALGLSVGCIRAGGILILLSPAEKVWKLSESRFIQHVINCLCENLAVIKITEDEIFIPNYTNSVDLAEKNHWQDYSQQTLVIEKIKRVALGHAKRPLVLQADRGRGKSSALGIAAAQLMQEKTINIVITASTKLAVQTVFLHTAINLQIESKENAILLENGSCLKYMPVDVLLSSNEKCDLLFIDEAASIPTALLSQLVEKYHRLVFATTIHGYEGNGQGFAVRFHHVLNEKMPQWRLQSLTNPIRWAPNDPLEQLCNEVLLLQSSLQTAKIDYITTEKTEFLWLDRNELLKNKRLLHRIFSLLVTAHYQTTPDDLRLLLDHPDLTIAIAQQNNHVLGVILLLQEGGFSDDEYLTLTQNNRRFKGHLIPQLLNVSGFPIFLKRTVQRVLRIAVHAECQRQGIGQRLFHFVEKHSSSDFIGASFSSDVNVLHFWNVVGMQNVRLGVHKESATGQYASLVLKANVLNANVLKSDCNDNLVLQEKLRTAFLSNIQHQLLTTNNDVIPQIIFLLFDNFQKVNNDLLDLDLCQVRAYCQKMRSFETIQPSLFRVLLYFLISGNSLIASNKNHLILVDKLFTNKSWQSIGKIYNIKGHKDIEMIFRQELEQLIAHI